MENVRLPPPETPNTRTPYDWIQRRYRVPDAVARVIAEIAFAAGVAAATGGSHVTHP